MRAWLASLRNGFTGIFRFSGRDDRALYWPYVFILLAAVMVAMLATMAPLMADSMARMQRFAAEHPDQATVSQAPGSYSISIEGHHPELMPDFAGLAHAIGAVIAVFVVLIAAATVRRLRDNGRGLWWALPPLFLLGAGLALFARVTDFTAADAPRLGAFLLLFANNMLYLATLGLLVFQLVRPPRSRPV